jgi:Rieske Fe-S protein
MSSGEDHLMDTPALSCLDRRCVLTVAAAGAAAALGGCASYGGQQAPAAPASSAPASSAPASPASSGAADAASPAAAAGPVAGIAALADIPVGGGKVFAAQSIVITQPAAGTVKAFSTVCTHAGCAVNDVSGGTINCPCHGSKYAIADGSVTGGPAPRPLPPIAVTVKGGQVVRS